MIRFFSLFLRTVWHSAKFAFCNQTVLVFVVVGVGDANKKAIIFLCEVLITTGKHTHPESVMTRRTSTASLEF